MTPDQIRRRVEELRPWGLRIDLGHGVVTPGPLLSQERWDAIAALLPRGLGGLRVLDVGCNAGFAAIQAKRAGAEHVVGLDFERYLEQARFVGEVLGAEVEWRADSIYRYRPERPFHVCLFLGLFYHLKHPLLALERVASFTEDVIFVETEALGPEQADVMRFVEHSYRNDDTVWWLPGENVIKGMLRLVGFPHVQTHPMDVAFGPQYSQGLTSEGIPKGRRILVVGMKPHASVERYGQLLSHLPELERELELDRVEVED